MWLNPLPYNVSADGTMVEVYEPNISTTVFCYKVDLVFHKGGFMGIDIIRGTGNKPVACDALADSVSSLSVSGCLYLGYPIIPTSEGPFTLDALLISKERGIVVFDLIEGTNEGDYCSRQYDAANKLESLLRTYRELMDGRTLTVPIHTISYAPAIRNTLDTEEEGCLFVGSKDSLNQRINDLEPWDDHSENKYQKSLSVLQNVSTIRKSMIRRVVEKEDSLGARLKKLEDSIATLDERQNRAVIETIAGVQRIRGLAGSGKTIILALKAAYLHIQHPDWRIAVTFKTRSLKNHFTQLIKRFTLAQAREEPDWNNLKILNAWGSGKSGLSGVYHQFCMTHDAEYFDFISARNKFGSGNEFSGACAHALSHCDEFKGIYDVILVDEAQDLPPEFLRICYHFLDEKKMLVYAYGELQNLSQESLPPPETIFGTDKKGSPLVTFETSSVNDIILKKCYRNSRPVLITAHALGFGIYRRPQRNETSKLVQMFESPLFWKEVGYSVKDGVLENGKPVILSRTAESSPEFLEDHTPTDDLIKFICFDSQQDQTEWLVNQIKHNLENDELQYEDIIVINPNPLTTRNNVGSVRSQLLDLGIRNHIAGVDTHPDIFFGEEKSITFTGGHRAKGNEAGMVYIINAHECCHGAPNGLNLARTRNQLFTAITRSKAWVRVLGVGDGMRELIKEYEDLTSKDFQLEFDYPTSEEIKELRVIHRDVTNEEMNGIKEAGNNLSGLIGDFESGKILLEDLNEYDVSKLRGLLEVAE